MAAETYCNNVGCETWRGGCRCVVAPTAAREWPEPTPEDLKAEDAYRERRDEHCEGFDRFEDREEVDDAE